MDDSSVHIDKSKRSLYQKASFCFDTLRFSFKIGQINEEMDVFLLDNQADEWIGVVFESEQSALKLEKLYLGRLFTGSIEINGQQLAQVILLLDTNADIVARLQDFGTILAIVSGRFQRTPKLTNS